MERPAHGGEHTVLLQRIDFGGEDLPSAIPDYEVQAPRERCIQPRPLLLPPELPFRVMVVPCIPRPPCP